MQVTNTTEGDLNQMITHQALATITNNITQAATRRLLINTMLTNNTHPVVHIWTLDHKVVLNTVVAVLNMAEEEVRR